MDAEKEIIRDMWLYLKAHNDPPRYRHSRLRRFLGEGREKHR